MKYHVILVRMEIIKKPINNKYWRGFGKKGTLLHCCACMLSYFSCVQLCVTQWTIACQVPLSMGFSRQEQWNGLPFPPPGDLPNPGIKPVSPISPPDSSVGKESTCNAGDTGLIPGLGRSPGKGNSYLLQYSCLENSMDRGACGLQAPHKV